MYLPGCKKECREGVHLMRFKIDDVLAMTLRDQQDQVAVMTVWLQGNFMFMKMLFQNLNIKEFIFTSRSAKRFDIIDG